MHRIGTCPDEVNPPLSQLVRCHEAQRGDLAFALHLEPGRNANGTRLDALDIRRAAAVFENGDRRDRDSANARTLAQARRHEFGWRSAIARCCRRYSAPDAPAVRKQLRSCQWSLQCEPRDAPWNDHVVTLRTTT